MWTFTIERVRARWTRYGCRVRFYFNGKEQDMTRTCQDRWYGNDGRKVRAEATAFAHDLCEMRNP